MRKKKRPVPAGRYDLVGPTASLGLKQRTATDKITPSLRDGTLLLHIPGSELPGYDHSVPSGQKRIEPCRSLKRTFRDQMFFPFDRARPEPARLAAAMNFTVAGECFDFR
jgi:hypothetical protein